ncbi:cytochrome c family protein [bacterium]|nr:cytochrome c family protein [bacterium]MBU1983368.1 cytochrome c family protein [bacterium]
MESKWMKLSLAVFIILALSLSAALTLAEEQPAAAETKAPAYVGSSKCKMCHMGEKKGLMWEIWLESKHSKAMASLSAEKGEDKDPKCLKCHTTGYGAGGYGAEGMEEAMAAPEVWGAVGCESCHGPGSEYKSLKVMKDRDAAVKAGLWLPDEATCTKCHNEESPTFQGFNYEEMLAKIAHKLPAAPAEKGQ